MLNKVTISTTNVVEDAVISVNVGVSEFWTLWRWCE